MTVAYRLRGYDRRTEFLGDEAEIPVSMLMAVVELLPESEDDPALIDPRELTRAQAARVADMLGVAIDPDRFDYFVESEEEFRVVAAQREALRAGA